MFVYALRALNILLDAQIFFLIIDIIISISTSICYLIACFCFLSYKDDNLWWFISSKLNLSTVTLNPHQNGVEDKTCADQDHNDKDINDQSVSIWHTSETKPLTRKINTQES